MDTTAVATSSWGVDPALIALPAVVRTWRDYLAVRADPTKRLRFWSSADQRRTPDPDLLVASERYILDANAVLVEALPLAAGDSSRWVLRTMYVGAGTAAHPGLLAMERIYMVREGGRWVLAHASAFETEGWQRAQVGPIEYVVHPAVRFNAARAAETARWAEATSERFGITNAAPITYYQVPDLQAAFRVMGLDWAISSDRVGGKANSPARVVFAANPRFGEAYRHELVHVLLHPLVGGSSSFVSEGIAYWLGGARGNSYPEMMRDLSLHLASQPAVGLGSILTSDGSGALAHARLPAAAGVFEIAHRRGGDSGVLRFVAALGKDEPALDAVARALGVAPAELELAWLSVVRSHSGEATTHTN
ncbi:MAG: hypothetical protein ACR2GJ_01940 [Gemmatimonadaceae bacterium]